MKDTKVHQCISHEMVSQGLDEPPANRCRCREFISYKEANERVKNGEARWIVTRRERGTHEVVCDLCKADPEVKNCAACGGSGKKTEAVVWETYGKDIVRVSQAAVDKTEKKYRPALAMKTPRVATIESEHIENAYLNENKDAADRIEEYGMLILDARAFVGPNRIPAIGIEPADDPKTGTGRNYDFGRAI
jgi:RecJ-like exonuclease